MKKILRRMKIKIDDERWITVKLVAVDMVIRKSRKEAIDKFYKNVSPDEMTIGEEIDYDMLKRMYREVKKGDEIRTYVAVVERENGNKIAIPFVNAPDLWRDEFGEKKVFLKLKPAFGVCETIFRMHPIIRTICDSEDICNGIQCWMYRKVEDLLDEDKHQCYSWVAIAHHTNEIEDINEKAKARPLWSWERCYKWKGNRQEQSWEARGIWVDSGQLKWIVNGKPKSILSILPNDYGVPLFRGDDFTEFDDELKKLFSKIIKIIKREIKRIEKTGRC